MKEIRKSFETELDVQIEIMNLKKQGFKRTQNAYWVEWWENDDTRFILERDF